MLEISSYSDVNGVCFGAHEAEVIAKFGTPIERGVTHDGELELRFDRFVIRFDALSREFRECSLLPGCMAKINGSPVIWAPDYVRWLEAIDPDLKEVLGFTLSLKLGLALSGFDDDDELSERAVHAFRRGDWDQFKDRMKAHVSRPDVQHP